MGTPLRALLVEDDPADAELVVRELRRAGFSPEWQRVETASALTLALEQDLDIILVDHRLPKLDAVRVIRMVKERGSEVPVVVVSGAISEEVAVECMRHGAVDYLLEDRLARLGQAVASAVDARRLRADRRRTEEALRESEERFRRAFEDSATGMAIEGTDGRFVRVNRAFCELLGHAEDALVGRSFLEVTHPDDQAQDRARDQEMLAGQRHAYQVEKRYVHREGHPVWVLATVSAIRGPDGRPRHFLTQVQDVTERRRAEEARAEIEAQLRQSQKLEAVGRLAGGIAHDFNNLLAVILGYGELMVSSLHESDPLREDAEEIRRAAERAAALTRQLLVFSRRQVTEPRVLELDATLGPIVTLLRRVIGEDVEIVTRLGAARGRVRADAGQLEQVLVNLAVNARDAMPGGGRLTLETADVELDDGFAHRHPGLRDGPHVRLVVRDTGHGMPPEVQARIFEPFFTTKEEGRGTGLGLATVYGIVQQHQGLIQVESAPGAGTTFTIHLPRVEAPAAAAEAQAPETEPPRGSETILLVEDEPGVRRLVRALLERQGYTVVEAGGAAQALALAEVHPGPIHLLLTDIVMPEMNGRELARRLGRARPALRVLYMSGYADDAGDPPGGSDGPAGLLSKPFGAEVLARGVREALDTPREG